MSSVYISGKSAKFPDILLPSYTIQLTLVVYSISFTTKTKMKVALILLLSTILVQAKPSKKRESLFDPFALMVQKYISENDFNALCDLTKQIQIVLTETKEEADQKIIKKSLNKLKEATQNLENFHCQVPIITALVTSTEIADVITTILKNEENTSQITTDTPLLEIEQKIEPETMCNDCKVDYKEEDETREEFAQVLDEFKVEATGYQPKVIVFFSLIGVCAVVLVGLLVLHA